MQSEAITADAVVSVELRKHAAREIRDQASR